MGSIPNKAREKQRQRIYQKWKEDLSQYQIIFDPIEEEKMNQENIDLTFHTHAALRNNRNHVSIHVHSPHN